MDRWDNIVESAMKKYEAKCAIPKAYKDDEYQEQYESDANRFANFEKYPEGWCERNNMESDRQDWYNISERIPMSEQDIFLEQQGNLSGVYNHWVPEDFPKYWVVRRGPYQIVPEWDYMDICAIKEDGTIMSSHVCKDTRKDNKISERRFQNLVDKLSDPDHDILKIKKSYS